MKNNKIGVAIIGLGKYATEQIAPALLQTSDCYLAGIVTNNNTKIKIWKEKYTIKDSNIYTYENFDTIKDNPEIDLVYITLPNSMHADFTVRAANAGKHVLCEKPMATTVSDCKKMIEACEKKNVHLSIGYRLHYDPIHNYLIKLVKEKAFGEITKITTDFTQTTEGNVWRLNKKLAGGGPLVDLGVYCIQAVCYLTGLNPIAITAKELPKTNKQFFNDIEENLVWQMHMPNGLIHNCRTGYSGEACFLKIEFENGWAQLEHAYYYNGITCKTSNGNINFPYVFQQAIQTDGVAKAIKNNEQSIIPAKMGLRDMQIIEAIYNAMNTGEKVEVNYH